MFSIVRKVLARERKVLASVRKVLPSNRKVLANVKCQEGVRIFQERGNKQVSGR